MKIKRLKEYLRKNNSVISNPELKFTTNKNISNTEPIQDRNGHNIDVTPFNVTSSNPQAWDLKKIVEDINKSFGESNEENLKLYDDSLESSRVWEEVLYPRKNSEENMKEKDTMKQENKQEVQYITNPENAIDPEEAKRNYKNNKNNKINKSDGMYFE